MADTGPGIPPEIKLRIFEPFFTTRPPGQGSGLGLSLCYAIVTGHNGTIQVDSRPAKGAVFRIELPVVAPPVKAPETPGAELLAPVRGKTILVVDDDPSLPNLLAELLSVEGNHVDTAANGAVALVGSAPMI